MNQEEFAQRFAELTHFRENRFHPMVWLLGDPEIAEGVFIGGFSEVNSNGAKVRIGKGCDIASFVTINCADSHRLCIGLADQIERRDITLEEHVFVGSHSVIKGGAHIGHHSVVAAGTIVDRCVVPPYSLVVGNPMQIKPGYYLKHARPDSNDAA